MVLAHTVTLAAAIAEPCCETHYPKATLCPPTLSDTTANRCIWHPHGDPSPYQTWLIMAMPLLLFKCSLTSWFSTQQTQRLLEQSTCFWHPARMFRIQRHWSWPDASRPPHPHLPLCLGTCWSSKWPETFPHEAASWDPCNTALPTLTPLQNTTLGTALVSCVSGECKFQKEASKGTSTSSWKIELSLFWCK